MIYLQIQALKIAIKGKHKMFEDLKPHLIELRKRLFISVVALIVCVIACFGFWQEILAFISAPLKLALPDNSSIIFKEVTEPFFTAMKVAFIAGLLVSMPVVFWQFWLFVAPGLYDDEKKFVLPFVLSATVMFFLGAAFCYYFVLPTGLRFLIAFGGELFLAMPSIGEFVGFFSKLVFAFGLSFELPVVTFFLAKIGLITDASLKGFFRYAVVGIFIFAAVMTPPDIFSQIMLAAPLVLLYVLSIYIAKLVNPADKELENDDDENDDENDESQKFSKPVKSENA